MKTPCKSCPFRKGFGERYNLCKERIDEIVNATAFQCHVTVDYEGPQTTRPQQCVGLMAVLHRENRHNQIMQIGERLGYFNHDELDPLNQAYDSLEDARAAHGN